MIAPELWYKFAEYSRYSTGLSQPRATIMRRILGFAGEGRYV